MRSCCHDFSYARGCFLFVPLCEPADSDAGKKRKDSVTIAAQRQQLLLSRMYSWEYSCFSLFRSVVSISRFSVSNHLSVPAPSLMTLDSSVLPPSLTYYCSHFPFAPLLPYSITNSPTHPGPKPPAYSSIPFLCLILPLHPHSRAFAPAAARRRQRRDCRRLVTASSTGAAGRPWGVAAEKEVACAAHARRCVGGGPAGSLACWVTAVGFIA